MGVPAKKTVKPKKSRRTVNVEKGFYFKDGTCIRNLIALADKIDSIDKDEFCSHVNDEKNDFANWIEHVFDEKALADSLRECNCKSRQVINILRFAVKELK